MPGDEEEAVGASAVLYGEHKEACSMLWGEEAKPVLQQTGVFYLQ